MHKILAAVLSLGIVLPALAQHRPPPYRPPVQHHRHNNNDWIGPLIFGSVITAIVLDSQRPPPAPQSIVITTPPSEVVYINGEAYRKQIMIVNGVYQEVLVKM